MRILVVEDEPMVADLFKSLLEEDGDGVDVAIDAPEGQSMAENTPYDLIILDLVLPGGNGLDVCKELREKKYRHSHFYGYL